MENKKLKIGNVIKVSIICVLALLLQTACIKDNESPVNKYYRIQQEDLNGWDFGIASINNDIVLVKNNDDIDSLSYVLMLLHNSEDTISLTFNNDTLTDFYYNRYHFMVNRMDTMLVFTTIDSNMVVSYTIPYYESNTFSKGGASTLLKKTIKIVNGIFDTESGIDMLRDLVTGDTESFMHDLGEFVGELGLSALPSGFIGVFGYELYKHYIEMLHNKAILFHLGNASCIIQSIQQNESDNTIEVTVSVINGEVIPDEYTWKNYWGQQITSPNIIYFGVLCRVGYLFPTLQKFDYCQLEGLWWPHASITYTFSFPVLAVEKMLFRPFLGFNYNYHSTALQEGYKKADLAKYGNVEEFYPEFEITTISNPLEGGTITGGGRYAFNTQVTLTATANNGYEFTHWNDGSTLNTRTITVERDATYTAYFTIPLYSINTIANPSVGGSVTGGGSYPAGTTITLSAVPNPNYVFNHWNDGLTEQNRTITVYENKTYTAYFGESYLNLAGQWTFNQTHSLTNPLSVNLVLVNSNSNGASYQANNLPDGYRLSLFVRPDRTVSIELWDPVESNYHYEWVQWATFEGVFNDTYTSVSGSSYMHEETSYIAPTGWQVNDPWSFHR